MINQNEDFPIYDWQTAEINRDSHDFDDLSDGFESFAIARDTYDFTHFLNEK
jgi:hypothetical protein